LERPDPDPRNERQRALLLTLPGTFPRGAGAVGEHFGELRQQGEREAGRAELLATAGDGEVIFSAHL
jgi:hypothetical protein